MKKYQGFTIVEMLIVVTIIAVLAGLILRGMGSALPKSRDARRIGDLKNIENQLEMFYNITNSYPTSTSYASLESSLQSVLGSKVKLPQDPSGGTNTYYYCPDTPSVSGAVNGFILGAQLELSASMPKDSLTGVSCGGKTCGTNNFYCIGM